MADTHEEQLLSDLLRGIARDDARLDAPHLESRVMAAADRDHAAVLKVDPAYLVAAAALVAAVLVPAMLWLNPQSAPQKAGATVVATEEIVPEKPAGAPRQPARARTIPRPLPAAHQHQPTVEQPIAQTPIAEPESTITTSPITQSPDEFVPLLPITAQELTGSLQIVRVQMPNASLGPLRSPRQHPGELVEADVLLGEDGMARAIRLSTSGSVSPWRPR